MPFNNDIAGGNGALVRNQLISPNFVSGVSGWRIAKDGSVEFNNGTFRGSITSGTNPGQHIVINNSATGDAVDVYDAGNNLVYLIDNTGLARAFYRGGGLAANTQVITGVGTIFFDKIPQTAHASSIAYFPNQSGVAGQMEDVHIQVPSSGAGETFLLDWLSGSFDGTKKGGMLIGARGQSGYAVYTDTQLPDQGGQPNVMHAGSYSGTTGAGGTVTFAHGCAFTPTRAQFTANDTPSFDSNFLVVFLSADATNCTVRISVGGTPVAAGHTDFWFGTFMF